MSTQNNIMEDLKKDLEKLRRFLDHKRSSFCKKHLEGIIEYYFIENEKEVKGK